MLVTGESHMYFVGEEAIADTDITQVILSCLTNTIFWSAIDSTGTFNSEVQHDLWPVCFFKPKRSNQEVVVCIVRFYLVTRTPFVFLGLTRKFKRFGPDDTAYRWMFAFSGAEDWWFYPQLFVQWTTKHILTSFNVFFLLLVMHRIMAWRSSLQLDEHTCWRLTRNR